MGFDFPNTPTNGQVYSSGGAAYQWDGEKWKGSSVPATLPPSDGGEYVVINGLWRLVRRAYDLGASTTIDIPVPATAKQARLSIMVTTLTSARPNMLLSADGTTFPAGASDYTAAGYVTNSGSAGFNNQAAFSSAFIPLTNLNDNAGLPSIVEAQLVVARGPSNWTYACTSRAFNYFNNAANLFQHRWVTGYPVNAAITAATRLAAFRIYSDGAVAWTAGSNMTVEWMY